MLSGLSLGFVHGEDSGVPCVCSRGCPRTVAEHCNPSAAVPTDLASPPEAASSGRRELCAGETSGPFADCTLAWRITGITLVLSPALLMGKLATLRPACRLSESSRCSSATISLGSDLPWHADRMPSAVCTAATQSCVRDPCL